MTSLHQTVAAIAVACALVRPLAASAATVELAAGTMVTSRTNSTIDSGSARAGDKFSFTVLTPYPSNDNVYNNARLYARVTRVVKAGQGQDPVLEFGIDRIVLANGRQASVSVLLQSQETQRHNNVGNVALTAVGAMIVGNMIGKSVFRSKLGGTAGLIAGALYASNDRTNVSLRQGSVVVTEVRRTVALRRPRTTAQLVQISN